MKNAPHPDHQRSMHYHRYILIHAALSFHIASPLQKAFLVPKSPISFCRDVCLRLRNIVTSTPVQCEPGSSLGLQNRWTTMNRFKSFFQTLLGTHIPPTDRHSTPLPTPPIPSRFILAQRRSRRSYTIFGDLKSGTRPFVVLIGSPCISQTYMLPARQPIQDIRSASRPVRPARRRRDEPAGFLTPALFVAELYNLVRHLRISSDFDLLGQSWVVTVRWLRTGHRDLSTSS